MFRWWWWWVGVVPPAVPSGVFVPPLRVSVLVFRDSFVVIFVPFLSIDVPIYVSVPSFRVFYFVTVFGPPSIVVPMSVYVVVDWYRIEHVRYDTIVVIPSNIDIQDIGRVFVTIFV